MEFPLWKIDPRVSDFLFEAVDGGVTQLRHLFEGASRHPGFS
jgi:hypothetical protein